MNVRMSATRLVFFYDYVSPYTYLASTQIDALGEKHGLRVDWEPALLGGVMKATGNQPPAMLPARATYMGEDLVRWAEDYGVPFRFTPFFPLQTMAALRAAIAVRARDLSHFATWNTRVFRAAWVEGLDVGNKEVLADIAREIGVDPAIVTGANDDAAVKERLKAQTEHVVSLGAFGFPWIVVEQTADDGAKTSESYFGNDRLAMVDARLRRGRPWPRSQVTVRL
jgi:2-hydroxychromene-2-carboxylate isomerase